ncbi:MAG: DUF1800 family protein [Anaerolineales bacterium]|nr:DUF1800 family protein [Anaerolineales bacterium]
MAQPQARINRRDFLKLMGTFASVAGASVAVTACAPEQVPGPDPTRVVPPVVDSTSVPPEPVLPPVPLGIIALNRMGFGPRPGDFDAFNLLGGTDDERLRAYVAQQLNPDSIDDSDFEARYNAAGFETLHKTQEELYFDHIANNPYDSNDDAYWDWYSKPAHELVDATFLRAVYSKKQLVEVLADFWHNHFNVYFWQDDGVPLLVSYNRDVLRKHMFGNFRQMLEAIATHPSMLYYLNQNNSSDAGPNENFARELFELHTLGAENYLGVRDPNTVEKDANGIAIGYVDNAPDQLKRVVEVILLSPEFRGSWGAKIKRPIEAAISIMRTLNADFTRLPGGIPWMCSMMGQPIFERRPPDGYPDVKEAWANSMSLLYRWNFAVGISENWMDDEEQGRIIRTDILGQTPVEIRTAESLADFWIPRLLNRTMSEADRQAVISVMAQDHGPQDELDQDHINWVLPAMVEVILMSPDFQWK